MNGSVKAYSRYAAQLSDAIVAPRKYCRITGTCWLEAEAADRQVRSHRRRRPLLHARHQLPQHAQQVPAAIGAARGRGCRSMHTELPVTASRRIRHPLSCAA